MDRNKKRGERKWLGREGLGTERARKIRTEKGRERERERERRGD